MICNSEGLSDSTVAYDTADGEAVSAPQAKDDRLWYIAIVPRMKERALAKVLQDRGKECLLPAQERVQLNSKGQEVIRLHFLFSGKVFVHITPAERNELNKEGVFHRFLIDISAKPNSFGVRPPAVVPADQMERFRLMLSQTDTEVSFEEGNFQVGDKVCVKSGPLKDQEGYVTRCPDGKSYLYITLNHLGCAKMQINPSLLRRINPHQTL